ncbi:MAG TPA: AAA family ATPase, partial [Polyangiales bacterium]|nr:AAA family ATPase [Polyangiales bacterium]
MLTGRHAFAARSFADVASVWRHGFALPSVFESEIPAALDSLVADLLQLEPDARPANASEVIERLGAIDGQAHVEHLQVAQAYLAMPPMIGRSAQLSQLQRALRSSAATRGSVVLVEGEAGVGRSRLLDAGLLDAALRGSVCVRADAEDAVSGDYGVLRALVLQLQRLLPELSQASSPGIELAWLSGPQLQDTRELRPKLQAAVQVWLAALSHKRALVLAVDDAERADEPSIAALALIASQLPAGVSVVLSAETAAGWTAAAAQPLLLEHAQRVSLQPLTAEESEQLLAALFNGAPNVGLLAHRLHEIAAGKPRDLTHLAEHLIDRGSVRYDAGAWTLPARLDQIELPSSMEQALRAKV